MKSMAVKSKDKFTDIPPCPIESESHFQHDREILKARGQVTRADEAIKKALAYVKELKATQIAPDAEKDRTSQVLAQRVYDLQKHNAYLRERLGLKGER